ncbi:hypothetical protein SK128_016573 [Halocaridina rubra]|uniref:Major facilitator superfamily (MFS) profile domain-containing protein n=1 Tax=Halocaridina rubra TaxID=373956 RepID=A0AAN8XHZ0_HALRR
MSENDSFDELLTTIGFGPWQAIIVLTTVMIGCQLPVQIVGATLLSGPMDFHCSHEPSTEDSDLKYRDIGNGTYFNNTCLYAENSNVGDDIPNSQVKGMNGSLTGLTSCPYIEYDTSIYSSTVISQWHLVCEQENLVPLFQMMYNIGGLFGCTLGGHIGDRFGRKRAIIIGSIFNMIAVVFMAFVPLYSVVLAMRLLVGCTDNLMLIPAWSLVLECTPSRHRSIVGMLLGLPYSTGAIIFGGISYMIRDWQYLLLICSSPILLILPLALYIDESPSWLIQQGRAEEATQALNKAANRNKAKLSTPVSSRVKELVEDAASSNAMSTQTTKSSSAFGDNLREVKRYLTSPAMRIILLTTPVLWFTQACVYLSVVINANNFTSTDPFLYMVLTGVMDASAILLSTPLATHFGRKVLIFGGMFIGAILFLLDLFIRVDYYWAKWILVMAGFLLVGAAFQLNYVYSPELFPTSARTRGFAFLNVIGQVGFTCAPLVTNFLAKYTWWAAGTFFGCAGILASLMIPFLPETRNKALPETLQDVEDRRNNSKKRKKVVEINEIKNAAINEGFSTEERV